MGVIKRCVKDLVDNWPLAYGECNDDFTRLVKLENHSARTALLIKYLFEDRLRILDNQFKELENHLARPSEIEYIAGLLHDLGKASSFYLVRVLKNISSSGSSTLKLSFPFHEHALSLLILRSSYLSDDLDRREINTYKVISRVISRHHVAIHRRHPYELQRDSGVMKETVIKAIEGLFIKNMDSWIREIKGMKLKEIEERIESYLNTIREYCESEVCEKLVTQIANTISKIIDPYETRKYLDHLLELVNFNLSNIHDTYLYESFKLTSVLTGYLIIADNLSASYCENRHSDDESTPAYVYDWRRELEPVLSKLMERNLPEKDAMYLGECTWI